MPPRTRLAGLAPTSLTPAQRTVYDAVLASPRGASARLEADGSLPGPFNAMLLSPAVGMALQNLGQALRYESGLPDLARELVILLVAGRTGSAYEQYAHEPLARQAGADPETLAALREGAVPDGLDPWTSVTLGVADALLAGGLNDEEYADAVAGIGERALFEINAVVGYYLLLARQLGLFDVGAPPGHRC